MTHLDTSFLVDLLREAKRGEAGVAHKALDGLWDEPLAISVHVACELHAGVELSSDPLEERGRVERLLGALEVIAPDDDFPAVYGGVLAELRRRGQGVPTMDLLIATAALQQGATLITKNARDFDRVPGLLVKGY